MSYEPRIDDHGRECCTRTLADGSKAYGVYRDGRLTACAACRSHHLIQAGDVPDPYRSALATLRTASAPDPSSFEARWQSERLRDLAAEAESLDADTPRLPRLTAAELATYEPPNAYGGRR